jgi:hypothetical protein
MNRLTVLNDCLLPISVPFLNSLALFSQTWHPTES